MTDPVRDTTAGVHEADLEWTSPGIAGDDDRTGRRVHFAPRHVVAGRLLPLQAGSVTVAPDDPPLTDQPSAE